MPKQWGTFIPNPQNKINLCNFLSESLCNLGRQQLSVNQKLVIGGGFKDGTRTVTVRSGHCEDGRALTSDHEEADTRLLLHAKYAADAHPGCRIVIQSPDTDVFALSVAHFADLNCRELWFKTGVKDRLRYIPVHEVSQALEEKMCQALLPFHALTGCDSTSAITGIGKKRAWDVLQRSEIHQESLGLLGMQQSLNDVTIARCEAFVCDLYACPKKTPRNADELRYMMFCQKKKKKTEERDASPNLRQFATAPETRKLPGPDLEELSRSNAESSTTRRQWMGEGRCHVEATIHDEATGA